MKPNRLATLVGKGKIESYPKGQVFHSLDFKEKLYVVKKGYVKRYQVTEDNGRAMELIYGPSHFFPLTQVYKKFFNVDHSQESLTYVYQAMTDVELQHISGDELVAATENDPKLYIDLFYEAGLRLKSNVNRLASNALKHDDKKVAHQLVCLADEFGEASEPASEQGVRILTPLEPVDMAEQLNITTETASAIIDDLVERNLLVINDNHYFLPDLARLKDVYL